MNQIVVIGGGHAAASFCTGIAEAGLGAQTHLVSEETWLPYHRPPLSKTFLKNPDEAPQILRAEDWYRKSGITLHLGDAATAVDREARTVTLRSGAVLPWDRLVLATGTRARQLPGLPSDLDNVAVLRSAADAHRLRKQFAEAKSITVLGGGFIGLEVAATARALGKDVTVLESAPRLLQRATSPELSAHVLAVHRNAGIDVQLGVRTEHFDIEGKHLRAVVVGGKKLPVELLLLGVGAVPEITLALAAGLRCEDGIDVDAFMQTSDPSVLAIGDCTRYPDHRSGFSLRLESVQNANDQARAAIATIKGAPIAYEALPWFWSEQGGLRLQMAGLMPAETTAKLLTVRRPGPTDAAFSLLHYVDGSMRCVESVNIPVDHLAARKLLEAGRSPDPDVAIDRAVPLKSHL